MIEKKKIIEAVEAYIKSKHNPGEHTGGSGHKGFVSYTIDDFVFEKMENGNIRVTFQYTIRTETEFTYYPDNPPYEDHYETDILLDEDLNILET